MSGMSRWWEISMKISGGRERRVVGVVVEPTVGDIEVVVKAEMIETWRGNEELEWCYTRICMTPEIVRAAAR